MSERRGDRVYTPDWVAADMVDFFRPSGRVLEPFKGQGVFLKYVSAYWCEIDEGMDFFNVRERFDWIISNPPYSRTRDVFRHSYSIASEIVYLVPLRNVFSGAGFVREIMAFGGMPNIRLYGTGSSLGFPMGNAVGAIHVREGYRGPTVWTDAGRVAS